MYFADAGGECIWRILVNHARTENVLLHVFMLLGMFINSLLQETIQPGDGKSFPKAGQTVKVILLAQHSTLPHNFRVPVRHVTVHFLPSGFIVPGQVTLNSDVMMSRSTTPAL